MKYLLSDLIKEYTERNAQSLYKPVAVGKYGIRQRSDIYKKELAKDYSKNKVIKKDTMIIGMGSTQIDIGVLCDDAIYSVSPAYHTFYINKNVVKSKYFDYLLQAKNTLYTSKYMIASARQGKTVNLKDMLLECVDIPSFDEQEKTIDKIETIKDAIKVEENGLKLLDELIKSRFIEMFMVEDKDKYPLKKWKDVVAIKHGKDYKKNIVETDGYPVYGSGGFMGVYADKYLVNENAIIIGRKGTIDKPILVKEKFWNVDTAFGIEVNSNYLNPIFFYIRSTLYDLKSMSTSTTLPSMTQSTLNDIEIGVPPIELQNQFASFVEQIDKSKFIVLERIKLYQELLNKKMDEYFN